MFPLAVHVGGLVMSGGRRTEQVVGVGPAGLLASSCVRCITLQRLVSDLLCAGAAFQRPSFPVIRKGKAVQFDPQVLPNSKFAYI